MHIGLVEMEVELVEEMEVEVELVEMEVEEVVVEVDQLTVGGGEDFDMDGGGLVVAEKVQGLDRTGRGPRQD